MRTPRKLLANEEIDQEGEEKSTPSRVAPPRIQFALPPSCQSQLKAFTSSPASFLEVYFL